MNLVRSALFQLALVLGTTLYVFVALVAAAIGETAMRRVIFAWARFVIWSTRRIAGIEFVVEGEAPREVCLVASKHESIYETILLILLLDTPIVILKRSLAEIPGWGWLARRYGAIPIDQEGGPSALRGMIGAVREARAQERQVIIYPEGTRIPPGAAPPLRAGFAALYRLLDLPVVAVAVTSGHVWPSGTWIKRPGSVTLRFSDPIPPRLPRPEIEARVHAAINVLGPRPGFTPAVPPQASRRPR